jgi:hypothetical protein
MLDLVVLTRELSIGKCQLSKKCGLPFGKPLSLYKTAKHADFKKAIREQSLTSYEKSANFASSS